MADGRALLRARQFFEPRQRSADGWNEVSTYARDWEQSYRRRWHHDRVVRSTHGVNWREIAAAEAEAPAG
jgi:nitrate reductase / nitrite oxidoreductase, alpha subunit